MSPQLSGAFAEMGWQCIKVFLVYSTNRMFGELDHCERRKSCTNNINITRKVFSSAKTSMEACMTHAILLGSMVQTTITF